MLHQVLFSAWDVCIRPPPSDDIILSDGHIKSILLHKKGLRMTWAFVALFYSTFFAIVRQGLLLNDGERRRTILLRCRGPPLLRKIPIQKIRRTPHETAALHKDLRYHRQTAQHTSAESALCVAAIVKIFCPLKKIFLNRKGFFLFKIYTPQHGS